MNGKPWETHEVNLLGKAPDGETAKLLGRSINAIRRKRQDENIKSFVPHKREWKDYELQFLGKIPDAVLAKQLGITRKAVISERKRRGIPNAKTGQ